MWTPKTNNISRANVVGFAAYGLTIAIALIQGRWGIAAIFLLGALASWAFIHTARSSHTNDLYRILMLEPRDERDQTITAKAFITTAFVDLWVSLGGVVTFALIQPKDPMWLTVFITIEVLLVLKMLTFAGAAWFYSRRL